MSWLIAIVMHALGAGDGFDAMEKYTSYQGCTIELGPGGFVPAVLVNWFQQEGMAQLLKGLHVLALRERR